MQTNLKLLQHIINHQKFTTKNTTTSFLNKYPYKHQPIPNITFITQTLLNLMDTPTTNPTIHKNQNTNIHSP